MCTGKNARIGFIRARARVPSLPYPIAECYEFRRVLWDQDTYHTSNAVEEWLADHPRIRTMELPKYAPELNPVEHIWRQLKDRVAANLTRSLESVQDACDRFFQQHCPDEMLKMAGLAVHS